MQYLFGPGRVWLKQLTDITGVALVTPVLKRVGAVQAVTMDIDRPIKELYGGNWLPLDNASGPGKISGKVTYAATAAGTFDATMLGTVGGIVTGRKTIAYDEKHAIPATPFQITVTPPGSGTFDIDLGVRNAAGNSMKRVASAPATNQYMVTEPAGQYTFAAADTGLFVFLDYRYILSTAGFTASMTNQEIGASPTFEMDFQGKYGGKTATFVMYAVKSTKLTTATKIDNYNMPEFDYSVFSPTGNIGESAVDMYIDDL